MSAFIRARLPVLSQRLVATRNLSSVAAKVNESNPKSAGGSLTIDVTDGVAVITLDQPNSKVNTLGSSLIDEFNNAYDSLLNNQSIRAAVVISGKPDGFIAGADIDMLRKCKSKEETTELAQVGQRIFNKISDGRIPVVAAIHGKALGGGLELALGCHYRIATSSSGTKMGLPEVKLGLLPGAGGTQRLPRLIGLDKALPFLLTGKEANAKQAKKIGLIDQVVERIGLSEHTSNENTLSHLRSCAIKTAKDIADGKIKIKREHALTNMKGLKYNLTNNFKFSRDFVFKKARQQAMKASGGLYPAIPEILDVVQTGLEKGMPAGLDHEARGFGKLSQTDESKALIGLFFGMTACKKVPKKFETAKKMEVKSIGVLGAGLMGAGIAEVSLNKFNVVMKDSNLDGLGRGLEQIQKSLSTKVKRKRMSQFDADKTMASIKYTTSFDHFGKLDLVVEAVPENLALKHKVIQELERYTKPTSIFATNTSALPIADIAKASKRPENVVGMHYFSPVPKMALLEIIPHSNTADSVSAAAFRVGTTQGKTCIVVKDVPGFYVNRSLGPYMAEIMALVAEGADPQQLDKALTSFGFPIGPVALADEVGIDVAAHVQSFLSQHLGVRMSATEGKGDLLNEMISKNMLGRKSGSGFFVYPKKGKKSFNPEIMDLINKARNGRNDKISIEDMRLRSVNMMVNEAAYCLQDNIILNPVDGDIGLVFGCGFLPNRGGPFRYLDSIGVDTFVDQMNRYKDQHGERFTPAPILLDYVKQGKKFHSN